MVAHRKSHYADFGCWFSPFSNTFSFFLSAGLCVRQFSQEIWRCIFKLMLLKSSLSSLKWHLHKQALCIMSVKLQTLLFPASTMMPMILVVITQCSRRFFLDPLCWILPNDYKKSYRSDVHNLLSKIGKGSFSCSMVNMPFTVSVIESRKVWVDLFWGSDRALGASEWGLRGLLCKARVICSITTLLLKSPLLSLTALLSFFFCDSFLSYCVRSQFLS